MELRVLGPVELWHEGRTLGIAAGKPRALLALLAIHANQVVAADRLIDSLWDGDPPASAKAALHTYVHRLRRLLDAENPKPGLALRTHPAGYLLQAPADGFDQERFERLTTEGIRALEAGHADVAAAALRTGLALWRGHAYADIALPAVREHARFLDHRRLEAAEHRMTAELELGRQHAVIAELEALVVDHPLRERLWELLMAALYTAGRRADAFDAYRRLHRLLDTELGVQPGEAIQELHRRILNDEPLPASTRAAPPGPPGHPVPHQLPTGVDGFVGRAGQLADLNALLPDRGGEQVTAAVISAIAGTAGVGKTVLALHWAHQVADRFPDGRLYVNLRGFDPSRPAMRPDEAVRGFLESLGIAPERVPNDPDAQIGLYRSLLAGRKVLVVLDNAIDEAQVRPLLPCTPGSFALVTSRNQLPGLVVAEAAHPLQLDVLPPEEARRLLEERIGKDRLADEPGAADDIITACVGLPLALAIVAARAATRPDFPLRSLAADLAGSRLGSAPYSVGDPAADIRAAFSWSYRLLSPAAARLFRLLGLCEGPDISLPAVAGLAGVPAPEAARHLAELTKAHLVNESAPGRYALHDLLRAYAGELARAHDSETERRTAVRRLLDHYLHTTHGAAFRLHPHRNPLKESPGSPPLVTPRPEVDPGSFDTYEHALTWLSAERSVLMAAVRQAAEAGFDVHACQLAELLGLFLLRQSYWPETVEVQRLALAASERLANRAGQAEAHLTIGRAFGWLECYDDARAHLEAARVLHGELGDRIGQAHDHNVLGWASLRQEHYADALGHSLRALDLFRAAGHRLGEGRLLNDVGCAYLGLGQCEQALTHCQAALDLARELDDNAGAAQAWDSLGMVYQALGRHRRAIDCYRQARGIQGKLGKRYDEADTLDHLGATYHAAGDSAAARTAWQRALAILEDLHHPDAAQVRAKLDSVHTTRAGGVHGASDPSSC